MARRKDKKRKTTRKKTTKKKQPKKNTRNYEDRLVVYEGRVTFGKYKGYMRAYKKRNPYGNRLLVATIHLGADSMHVKPPRKLKKKGEKK